MNCAITMGCAPHTSQSASPLAAALQGARSRVAPGDAGLIAVLCETSPTIDADLNAWMSVNTPP
jgi:hypothetical protein